MGTLLNKTNKILNEKTTKIIPENIKEGVQIFDIVGTYSGSVVGGNVKRFNTIKEMQADKTAQDGDLAIVYLNQQNNMTKNSIFSKITLPETVVLDTAIEAYIEIGFKPVDKSVEMDCYGNLDSNRMNVEIYIMPEGTNYRIQYESQDGITYTRRSSTPEEIDFGFDVEFRNRWGEANWDDRIGQFFIVSQTNFDGLFNYISSDWSLAPTQLSAIPEYVYKGKFYTSNGVQTGCLNNKDTEKSMKVILEMWDYCQNGIILPENASNLFYNVKYDTLPNVKCTNITTNLSGTFDECYPLQKIITNDWIVDAVVNTSNLFHKCGTLTNIDVSNWNTSNMADMSNMFSQCHNLTNIDVSNWNTSNTVNLSYMFFECRNLTNINVSNWNTINAANLSYMFGGCRSLTNIDVSNWDTGNVGIMSNMFSGCRNLTDIDVSNWNTCNVVTMYGIFGRCSNLVNLNISNWDTSNLQNMDYTFDDCYNLANLDISNWNTSSVKTMSSTFGMCSSLTNLDVSNWNTSNVTYMYQTFNGCRSLTNINVSNWNTSNVTNMQFMFNGCSNLTNLDVSNWNTNKVVDTAQMFSNCSNLTEINITNWDVSELKYTSWMFANCRNLINLDISNWKASNITQMYNMFQYCNNLSNESIDSIINMFLNATNVTYKNLSTANYLSPFQSTNITNNRYRNRWAELDATGWIY